jgi:pilus assembly protein CpaB
MMQNKGKTFFALAGVLGLAAAIVGYYSLTALAARAASGGMGEFQDVVVTATDLTFGVKLDAAMLRVVKYPKDAVPGGAYSTVDSVIGQTSKVFMSTREPVTALKLSSRGGGLSMLVRPTMRAVSIQVNNVSGVSGFVLPGDRVDVLTTVDQRGVQNNAVTSTLLQNVEVLASGTKTEQKDSNKPLAVQAVTLLVDPDGAEKIAHAQYEGEIHLVLRNPEDHDQVEVGSFSTAEMLGGEAAKPARRGGGGRAAPVRTASKPSDKPKVRIIRSASVTEVSAVQDSSTR